MIQYQNAVKFFTKAILGELSEVCMCWVAGGCVRDYFCGVPLKSDIDLYFPDDESVQKAIKYFMEADKGRYKSGDDTIIFEKKKAIKLFENDNVMKVRYNGRVFDIVKKTFPSPKHTIEAFDFTVSCGAVDIKSVYVHNTFFIDLSKRQLMINALPYPLSTLWRLQKYIKKGFTICAAETLKLGKAIGELQVNTAEGEAKALDLSPMSGDIGFASFD